MREVRDRPAALPGCACCLDRATDASWVAIRVLRPVVEVEVAGVSVTVRPAVARLLVTLIAAHPRPLHVEQVAEQFWPGEPLSRVRSRIDSLAHRLRRTLGPAGDCVTRTEGRLALDPSRAEIDVDLFTLRAAMPNAPVGLLAAVTGNLCEAQFPYDELLVDARHRFASTWLTAARRTTAPFELFDSALHALGLAAGELELSR